MEKKSKGLQDCVNPFDRSDDVSDQPNAAQFVARPPLVRNNFSEFSGFFLTKENYYYFLMIKIKLTTPGTPFLESAEEASVQEKPPRARNDSFEGVRGTS